jgi:hypothetical protein
MLLFVFSSVQTMTNQRQVAGWSLCAILMSHCLLMTFAYPQQFSQQQISAYQQPQQTRFVPGAQVLDEGRKYAEKSNALKKVALDDIDDDIQTNQINDNGFSWSNMLGGDEKLTSRECVSNANGFSSFFFRFSHVRYGHANVLQRC